MHLNNKKYEYSLYQVGTNKYHGVGLLVSTDLNPRFIKISDRICKATMKIDKNHLLIVICAYAPTTEVSRKDPQQRENFYDQLDSEINVTIKSKHTLIVVGDFNAKTGSGHKAFPQNIGKFGKGKINENGTYLLEMCKKHDLFLTNTIFDHKLSHRTTWTSPKRNTPHLHYDGTIRRNPYRNQIDYIIMKCNQRCFVTNSRSYNGVETSTDHKLVKDELKLDWWKMRKHQKGSEKIDV